MLIKVLCCLCRYASIWPNSRNIYVVWRMAGNGLNNTQNKYDYYNIILKGVCLSFTSFTSNTGWFVCIVGISTSLLAHMPSNALHIKPACFISARTRPSIQYGWPNYLYNYNNNFCQFWALSLHDHSCFQLPLARQGFESVYRFCSYWLVCTRICTSLLWFHFTCSVCVERGVCFRSQPRNCV